MSWLKNVIPPKIKKIVGTVKKKSSRWRVAQVQFMSNSSLQ